MECIFIVHKFKYLQPVKPIYCYNLAMFRPERILLLLFLLTLLAIAAYNLFMDSTLVVSPKTQFRACVTGDSPDGGQSTALMTQTDSSWILSYEIKPGFRYPYATISFFAPAEMGFLNLTQYDSILVRMHLGGQARQVRIQIRNINLAYTVAENALTMKYNELQFDPKQTTYPAVFRWEDFRVPPWWTAMLNLPYWHARTDVSQVSQIDVTTGDNMEIWSKGTVEVVSITFIGKQISPTKFYQGLLGIWLLSALVVFAISAFRYRKSIHEKVLREQHLVSINSALAIKSKEMESIAKRDALTGAFNRNGLRDKLAQVMEDALLRKSPFSIIMVDIDYFKKINDTFGHARGDEILREVADSLTNNTRMNDATARWGGEEFLILCPSSTLGTTSLVAEKLRRTIEAQPSKVTCSLGVAEWKTGEELTTTIGRADSALYFAKQSGRNQVKTAT
jgi:diguanylate cyclase (GGDEF)-like protein